MARRLIITAGWLAAAVLAVLVGLVAVSLIGDGLVSPAAKPLSQSDVARELAAEPTSTLSASPSTSPAASASPSTSTSAPSSGVSQTFRTRAGTVVARCDGDRGSITLMSPGSGFTVHERNGSEGEFRGISDDHDRVKVDVSCADGRPKLEVESRDD